MSNSGPAVDALSGDKIGNIGFAASPVLPGEDEEEFVALFTHLTEEFAAQGHLESDAALTMASAIWRKQNLSIYRVAAEARARYGHFFRFPNDHGSLWKYDLKDMGLTLHTFIEAHNKRLRNNDPKQSDDENDQINNCINSEDFKIDPPPLSAEDSQAYAIAEATERIVTLMSQALGSHILEELKQAKAPVRDPLVYLALLGELVTPECLIAELDMVKRLDDTIDRSYNRLMKFQAARTKSSARLLISPLLHHIKSSRKG
jgi:hypothetical protein